MRTRPDGRRLLPPPVRMLSSHAAAASDVADSPGIEARMAWRACQARRAQVRRAGVRGVPRSARKASGVSAWSSAREWPSIVSQRIEAAAWLTRHPRPSKPGLGNEARFDDPQLEPHLIAARRMPRGLHVRRARQPAAMVGPAGVVEEDACRMGSHCVFARY
jgi:hypothetical protein